MIYITTRDEAEALMIGKTLVGERLAACSNIVAAMKSIYEWQGSVQNDQETILILKTGRPRVKELITRVKQLHSYTVPCIVALPVADGNPDYIRWVWEMSDCPSLDR